MKKLLIGLSSLLIVLFNGCGGGGGGSTPAEPNTNQYDLRTWVDTAGYHIDGEGTITAPTGTFDVDGFYRSFYEGTSIAPTGETVHNHFVTLSLTAATTSYTQYINSTTYEGNLVYVDNVTDGIVCETPLALADLTPVPTDAQVGYISDIIPLECSDGSYITNVIKLSDAGGGNAELSIISNTYVSQGGALEGSETDSIIVTPTMSIVNAEITGSIPADGITFALSSTLITEL